MQILGEPTFAVELPVYPSVRRSGRIPDNDLIPVTLKATFTLPPPGHRTRPAECDRVFLLTRAELLDEHIIGPMLAVVGAPAVRSVVDRIIDAVTRMWDPNVNVVMKFVVGFVVLELPRLPEPEPDHDEFITYLRDVSEFVSINHTSGDDNRLADDEAGHLDLLFNESGSVFVPASKESIEGLEKVVIEEPLKWCSICLEDIRVGSEASRLPCSHSFHGGCIGEWLGKSKYCPLCRFEMPS